MSKYRRNGWHTTDLVRNVMSDVARRLELDIHDDEVADKLYWICCDLEEWECDEWGSSDSYSYVQEARRVFGLEKAA